MDVSKSLGLRFPNIASEWNYAKNANLSPLDLPPSSTKRVWWVCENGHEYRAVISYKVSRGKNCGKCKEVNDKEIVPKSNKYLKSLLAAKYPGLSREWHPTKNLNLTPTNTLYSFSEKVWWKCSKGHPYQATIAYRISNGNTCPKCKSPESWLLNYPELTKLYNEAKNSTDFLDIKIRDSENMYSWKCKNHHEWQATAWAMYKRENKCKACEVGVISAYPQLLKEFYQEKNVDINPDFIPINYKEKIYWKGYCGHEWQARISERILYKGKNIVKGCPYCLGYRVLPGFNDLETLNPTIAAEWHPIKNGDLKPSEVSYGSSKKVWWLCKHGHEWQARTCDRTKENSRCSACSNNLFSPSLPSVLYFIHNKQTGTGKIGITNSGIEKINILAEKGWSTIFIVDHDNGNDLKPIKIEIDRWIKDILNLEINKEVKGVSHIIGVGSTFQMQAEYVAVVEKRLNKIVSLNLR